MADISLNAFARFFGVNTLLGFAQKVGLNPPPPPVSMRNVVDLAERTIKPLAPVDLQPVNGASGISNNPHLFFRDPGAGTPAVAFEFHWFVSQNDVIIDPTHVLTGDASINSPLSPPGPTWFFPLPSGQVTLTVSGENRAGRGPASTSTFTVGTPPRLPQPPPTPQPPQNLVGISKLSLFNCQIERHTVFVWVRDVTGNGQWGKIQEIPTQFNESGQCPFDDNGILADPVAILTKNGEEGGFACTSGNIYQVSLVDPERPTCDGRNDPTIGNCVVEDQPSFFKFHADGDEATVMLEDGRLSPVPI
jgi:hypothetical protein